MEILVYILLGAVCILAAIGWGYFSYKNPFLALLILLLSGGSSEN